MLTESGNNFLPRAAGKVFDLGQEKAELRDRYGGGTFGQRLVIAAGARELVPYLPDAVPGWFQATLALYDAIYRGREDFVYRIVLGELPFITSIFPLGGKAGAQTTIELAGWNLPVSSLVQDTEVFE